MVVSGNGCHVVMIVTGNGCHMVVMVIGNDCTGSGWLLTEKTPYRDVRAFQDLLKIYTCRIDYPDMCSKLIFILIIACKSEEQTAVQNRLVNRPAYSASIITVIITITILLIVNIKCQTSTSFYTIIYDKIIIIIIALFFITSKSREHAGGQRRCEANHLALLRPSRSWWGSLWSWKCWWFIEYMWHSWLQGGDLPALPIFFCHLTPSHQRVAPLRPQPPG